MRSARIASLVAPLVAGLLLAACSDAGGEGTDEAEQRARVEAARTHAYDAYATELDEVYRLYATCEGQLETSSTCTLEVQGVRVVITPEPQDLLGRGRQVLRQIKQIFDAVKNNLCGVLQNFKALQHPYFFYGASGTGGAVASGLVGTDVVFDFWNNQAAVFYDVGGGAASMVGGEVAAYAGYAFGNKKGVLDAWSGTFIAGSLSGQIPVVELGAGGTIFGSPDGSLFGGAANVSFGLDLIPTPVDGSIVVGKANGWDAATRMLAGRGWFIRQKLVRDPATGRVYIQYQSSRDMALALLWNAPMPLGATAATQAVALGLLRDSGLTIEQMCPQLPAKKPPVFKPKQVAGGGGGSADGGAGSADGGKGGLSKTDCADKSDGWWCLDTGGGTQWMAYCESKQIRGGCACASCSTAGTKASCSASPPPAACPL